MAASTHVSSESFAPILPIGSQIEPERIAIFRALQLGDMLCAVPALRALRAAFPRARLTLIGLPWARAFVERFSRYLDDFIAFPGAQGLPERSASAAEIAEFQRQAYAARFDLALQLHGDGRISNAIVAALARECAGFHAAGAPNPDPKHFIAYPEEEPEILRLLRLVEFIGVPTRGSALEFPIAMHEWREAADVRARFGLVPGRYICIHPGARSPTRRWPTERFARVADRLASKGFQIVLTGIAEELPLTRAIAKTMLSSSSNLAGELSLGGLGALLAGAKLLVCNDTGVSHIAAALKVPSTVVYLGSSPARWAPLDTKLHRRVFHPIDCRPCEHRVCPIGHRCADEISADDVMEEVESLLS